MNGKRIDVCYRWGSECGAPAASAFCKKMGYAHASTFEVEKGVGSYAPTMLLSDGTLCNGPHCDGFARNTCIEK